MIEEIKSASKHSYHAQRNWDRSRTIPEEHISTLLEVIKNSPTKQGETHYKVLWTDDSNLIYNIYRKTKHFTVTPSGTLDYTEQDGKTKKEYNVRNSQIYSNLLFGFAYDWNQNFARSHHHAIVDEGKANKASWTQREKQMTLSMGIAVGELILSANLLGYRTGICSAFWERELREFFNEEKITLLVGVGYPSSRPRREHEEVLNKDILAKDRRTGADDQKWLFPAFKKQMTIKKI